MGVKVRQVGKDYWIFVDHKKIRRAKKIGTRQAAEAARIKIEARLADGGPIFVDAAPPVPTFKAVATQWLPWYRTLYPLRESTMVNYQSFIDGHLIPFFGDDSINSVTRARVQDFIAAKRNPGGSLRAGKALADSTLKFSLPVLRMVLDYGVERRYLAINPMRGGRLWRASPPANKIDPFTPQELRDICAAAESLSPQFGLMIRCLAQSGMRNGEIRALRYQDFDPRSGQVSINLTRTARRVGPPKTRGSVRMAALTFPVLEDIAEWQPTTSSTAVLARVGAIVPLDPTAPLFANPQGRFYNEFHDIWHRALRRAKVRYRSPHQLRHSFISTLVNRGAPLTLVAHQTGDSPTTLLSVYAHWMPTQTSAIPTQVTTNRQHTKSAESAG
jgi:integrase